MAMAYQFVCVGRTRTNARISAEIPDEWQSIVFDEFGYVFGTCPGRWQNVVSRFPSATGTSDEFAVIFFIHTILYKKTYS